MTRRFRLLLSGSFPEMAVSVFLPHGDPERLVSGVGRGRGGLGSQSVPDVVCRARRDWLAMTSCCSSGWGQSRRGRLLQRQKGRSDDGDPCCRGRYGTRAAAKGLASLFPDHFLLSLREVSAPWPGCRMTEGHDDVGRAWNWELHHDTHSRDQLTSGLAVVRTTSYNRQVSDEDLHWTSTRNFSCVTSRRKCWVSILPIAGGKAHPCAIVGCSLALEREE
ncbi:uncharacterized protein LOC133775431 isoform X2 [Lepus europaeus]|uniref:uncharacterized protein LOC133775431 isoform X2 n=1 Tax=Lepus europaeus TaxID=9983 RepID=UPI002B48E4AE|nr:uncharacterized protein LOC133775431 isoform X2 [Lepus europaeus]